MNTHMVQLEELGLDNPIEFNGNKYFIINTDASDLDAEDIIVVGSNFSYDVLKIEYFDRQMMTGKIAGTIIPTYFSVFELEVPNRQPYIFIEFFREIDSERSSSTAEIEICDQRPLLRVYRKKLDVPEISENQMSDIIKAHIDRWIFRHDLTFKSAVMSAVNESRDNWKSVYNSMVYSVNEDVQKDNVCKDVPVYELFAKIAKLAWDTFNGEANVVRSKHSAENIRN